jgi:hypothetical protein
MTVSAPLQNNITRFSGVSTKNENIKQSNHIGLLLKELIWVIGRKLFPMTFASAIFGGCG